MMADAVSLALDDHDRRLRSHVRPPDWRNPAPKARYDLVVIGGGTAGLVCAAGAAGLGARVALVEKGLLGGDCLNTGCVPSKALLRSARVVGEARDGASVGVEATSRVDFEAVMRRLRARRADLAPHDSAARLESLGVDVFYGQASFDGPRAVAVGDLRLPFRRAVIATGSRPAVPPIPGLASVPHHTNETIFSLTERPRDLAILGAGPVGCEMAQAFARLGTRVTLLDSSPQVLPREDPDAAALVAHRLVRDGAEIVTGVTITAVHEEDGRVVLRHQGGTIPCHTLLVAVGRSPNIEALELGRAGVRHGAGGVEVDDRLRTANRRIYAAGDVCSRFRFTHAADAMARIVVQNALFFGRQRLSATVIPWCTFTSPELAHVGRTASEAGRQGARTITIPLRQVDRAVVDEDVDGFVKIHHQRGRIVGATVVAPHAGEIIGLVGFVMKTGGTLKDLATAVFPYPTFAAALRTAGDAYRREGLTPFVRAALERYFRIVG